jgi:DNA transposition AAA+ family ATPase
MTEHGTSTGRAPNDLPVVVIGGGQAGLAAGYYLRRAGVRFGRRAVVVDEAQRLNKDCIEFLRYLHDDRRTRFALLLVGGDDAWSVLSREPMLRSRVYRRVALNPLSGPQVCDLMGSFHPIYDGADRELLLLIDDHAGHGNLRHWAAFTHAAAGLCERAGRDRVDEEIVRNTFAVLGAGVDVQVEVAVVRPEMTT